MRTLLCILAFLYLSHADPSQTDTAPGESPCLIFEKPIRQSIVCSPSCTISIAACSEIESIHLSACFFPGSGMTDTILDLGTISQPPFKLIWNISEIPNQLFRGMGFSANAVYKNRKHRTFRHDGIFLYATPQKNQEATLSPSADEPTLFFTDTLPSKGLPMVLSVHGNWNEKEIHFTVLVIDPSFSMSMQNNVLSRLGVELCIDPLLSRSPYPTESSLIVWFPLVNKPFRYIYRKADAPDGGWGFSIDSVQFPHPATIKTAEGSGYGLDITLPRGMFGKEMPESISCNILMKVLDRNGQINTISINRAGSSLEAYCPLRWVTLHRTPTGFFDNNLYVFLGSFGMGCIVAVIGSLLVLAEAKRTVTLDSLTLSEEDKQTAKAIARFIEQNVTKKDLSLSEISRNVEISGSKIERHLKKYHGLPFKRYIMKSRVEIAKERLRSSHASEASVAESCGFKNVDEMEKGFFKYCRTTPLKYRKDNQVV